MTDDQADMVTILGLSEIAAPGIATNGLRGRSITSISMYNSYADEKTCNIVAPLASLSGFNFSFLCSLVTYLARLHA